MPFEHQRKHLKRIKKEKYSRTKKKYMKDKARSGIQTHESMATKDCINQKTSQI